MKFLDEIMNETLIICKNSFKERVLELKRLIPIKFMGIDEFISKYYFSYDESAILYMMKKYGYKYEVAKMYLDNLYYIDDIKYGCEKLDFLVKIKQELENEGLLIYNDDFRKYISNVDVILYDIRMTKYLRECYLLLNIELLTESVMSMIMLSILLRRWKKNVSMWHMRYVN